MEQVIESRLLNNKRTYAFISKNQFLEFIQDKKKILIALNAEKLNASNQSLNTIINENIGYPDGVGAVLALKKKGLKSTKIAGSEFWLDVIGTYHNSKSFYLLGSSQEVIEKTRLLLKNQYKNIDIKGYRNGYLREGEEKMIMQELKVSKPDIIFVAMGSPKQEFLMDRFMKEYPALYMGLGGSFDVYSGIKKRAPKVYQKLGLEWFYRLLKEPTRLSRQKNLVKFFFRIIFNNI
ncbi:WecB/TagA/CpsF family glycosyltransferase [Flagellimonas sp. CMM7]|uniref:WecB/TagA/CpsF family glycosyltransferase n=1 Tax=Flagellimonas sp. CMM7 TaxID=2654676 RepID=UPI0013D1A7D0|nr:WecB/TagA/CpsF family glycosyltransferase [Flagellimonas sp. CMM7]UII81562.1 WecB/TagA/CpsF family glycosyltransferase [Flagellimonas sp. CMM7]